jgi:hypothetical protein
MASSPRRTFPLMNFGANPILRPMLEIRLPRQLAVAENVGHQSGDRLEPVTQYAWRDDSARTRIRTTDCSTRLHNFQIPWSVRRHRVSQDYDPTSHAVPGPNRLNVIAQLDRPAL